MATGGLVGLINALIVTRLRVVPFIATLGTLGIARGVAKWLANQETVNPPDTWASNLLETFPHPTWLIVSAGVWLAIVLAVSAAIVLRATVSAGASSPSAPTKRLHAPAASTRIA